MVLKILKSIWFRTMTTQNTKGNSFLKTKLSTSSDVELEKGLVER